MSSPSFGEPRAAGRRSTPSVRPRPSQPRRAPRVARDGCRARADRPLVAVRGAQGDVGRRRRRRAAERTSSLEEQPQQVGLDVGEAEAGVEVDVVEDELAQPHERDVLAALTTNSPGRALQARLGVLGPEPGQLRRRGRPRGALDVGDQLGGRGGRRRPRCRRRGPAGWRTSSRRCRRRPSATSAARPSALRATWVSTWPRVQPSHSDGARASSSERAVRQQAVGLLGDARRGRRERSGPWP